MNKPLAAQPSGEQAIQTLRSKPLKILLVLPAGESVRVTRQCPEVPRRAMLRFSVLPLTAVAALTPREHEVRIVDENVAPLDFDADCDVVGVSFMTALAPRAYEIAAEFRRRGRIVVGGGYHATLCPEDAAPHFNALVLGDAEGAWEQLLRDVRHGNLRKFYRQVEGSAPAQPGASVCLQTPVPRRNLLARTARYYATINAVQAGRGCRHNCRYCSVTVFHGRKYRHRPVADVMAELQTLPRNFIFVDDNIIAEREYALELFRALAPLNKRWVSQCSILIADDPELLHWAQAAGCRGLFIGIETASDTNLAAMNKQFNHSWSYADRLSRIRHAGIGVVAGMIVGMDADEPEVFSRTLRFLQETQIDAVQLNILTPLPGTPLFQDMESAGRITDRNWSHYDYRHVVFQPARMSAEELQAGADWLYAQFYRLDRILWRFVWAGLTVGWMPAWLGLKLGLTYRYDNRRERIIGWNPGRRQPTPAEDSQWVAAEMAGAGKLAV
ncbi:MAG TPA: radical SAM protein [Candidatus Acidoferrum sp.]|nr:radical SAM protein [Candidatus Acidoferrum sp.]